jgi:predicted ATPase
MAGGPLRSATIEWDDVADREAYPYSVPAIASLDTLDLSAAVTFFVGDNGTGKSTLLEAIAVAAGVNAEGGTRNLRFSNRPTESDLCQHLRLRWRQRPAWAFFLRSETFFSMATAYEEVDVPGIHERSHGEQFSDSALRSCQPRGFHLMDEPEAALSVLGQLKLMRRLHDVVEGGGQFVIATHSPILLAFPAAHIYEFSDSGIKAVDYEDTDAVRLTSLFLEAPERFLRHLLAE